jgi:hypothetical protein
MCITVGLGLLSSLAAAGMTAMSAHHEKGVQKYQMDVQNQQLKQEQDMIRLKAQQQEGERLDEASQMRQRNMAYLAGSGVGESQSFLQGLDPRSDWMLAQDLGTLGMNTRYQTSRIADQIHVNRAQSQFAGTKAGLETLGGFVKAGASVIGDYRQREIAANYYRYK